MCKQTSETSTTTTPTSPTVAANNDSAIKGRDPNTLVTNDELRSHNTPKDAWCAVHGKVITITEFAKRHPGGDLILLAAGKDATVLFETYHPRGVPMSLLDKLQVGVMKDKEFHSSFYSWDSKFYKTLKERVIARLNEKHLTRRGSVEIWVKAFMILFSFWFSLYKMCVTATEDAFYVSCLWSVSMGVWAALVGVCIQHDGNHGAFAFNSTVNKLAGWTLDMIGASAFTWEFQHMLGHHPYTNLLDEQEDQNREKGIDGPMKDKDQESDPDVFSSFPAMRMHPSHKAEWYHKYQHMYGPFLFAFMTLSKVLHQDMIIIFEHKLYQIDANCRYGSILNKIRFWVMKVVTIIYMLILPCYYHSSIVKGIALFLIGHFTCGEFLATMFIVNHVIEGVSFAKKNDQVSEDGNKTITTSIKPSTVDGVTPMEATQAKLLTKDQKNAVPYNDWAAVQCQTSVNWSSGSWFWNHFSGGLSHQIEHHLFPSICHTNYVHIQDVVEQTCAEFGVPYQNEPNLFVAYQKMMKHLKYMGNPPENDTTVKAKAE